MIVSLEELKNHLLIEECYNGEDSTLSSLISVSQKIVEKHSELSEQELQDNPIAKHCVLLMAGNLYNHRESVSELQVKELPHSFNYLIGLIQNYKVQSNE